MAISLAVIASSCSTTGQDAATPGSPVVQSSTNAVETVEKPQMQDETLVERKGEPKFDNVPPANVPKSQSNGDYLSRPAPEDSLFKAQMTNEGMPIETRTFKSHPQILKVERVWITPQEKRLKVYLRNGKTVEADGNSFDQLNIAASSQILEAAGIKPQVPGGNSKKSEGSSSKESN